MTWTLRRSDRLRALPPFLFNQIDDAKRAAIAAGKDVINLGVGDPDRPTPAFVIDAMNDAIRLPANHQYPDGYGTRRFLDAAARFMQRRFGVNVDPARHLVALIGSKDGISNLPLGLVNPGDGVLVFAPAYPVYAAGTILAGGTVHRIETTPANGWRPDFAAIGPPARDARLMWLNFPGNPTGAVADAPFFDRAIAFAAASSPPPPPQRNPMIVASDLAYSEIYFDESKPIASLWQAPSANLDHTPAIEFHSLSKTFNMTGWRIGFAVGHEQVIAALKQVKDNYDSGPFNAIQNAAAVALDRFDDPEIAGVRSIYRERRDMVINALRKLGCDAHAPEAGIFVWSPCPRDPDTGSPMDSWRFARRLIEEAGVVTVPGAGFAESASQWFRVSLTRETARIAEAMHRLGAIRWS